MVGPRNLTPLPLLDLHLKTTWLRASSLFGSVAFRKNASVLFLLSRVFLGFKFLFRILPAPILLNRIGQ